MRDTDQPRTKRNTEGIWRQKYELHYKNGVINFDWSRGKNQVWFKTVESERGLETRVGMGARSGREAHSSVKTQDDGSVAIHILKVPHNW